MKPFEERYTAWIDGELTGADLADFEAELSSRGELPGEKASLRQLGDLLRGHAAAPPLTNCDFFNHQLLQRIEREEAVAAAPDPEPRRAFRFPLLRIAWAGAFSFLIAAALFHFTVPAGPQVNPTASTYMAQVLDAHSDDPAISASAFHSKKDDVTVLWLGGLDYIPADYAEK